MKWINMLCISHTNKGLIHSLELLITSGEAEGQSLSHLFGVTGLQGFDIEQLVWEVSCTRLESDSLKIMFKTEQFPIDLYHYLHNNSYFEIDSALGMCTKPNSKLSNYVYKYEDGALSSELLIDASKIPAFAS